MPKPSTYMETVSGKATWARLATPEEWEGKSYWKITLHPDPESLEKIRDLQAEGLKNQLKKDDDGYYCTFRRPTVRKTKAGEASFGPPIVKDKEGKYFRDALIGDGSDVTLTLEVYAHGTPGGGKAKAARLAEVKIDNLIEYVPGDLGPQEEKVVAKDNF